MKKLKIILQSNLLYIILFLIIFFYVLTCTKIINYESIFSNETSLTGIITDVSYKSDKITFTLKSDEKIICNYYLKDNSPNYRDLLGKKVKVFGKLKSISNNTIPNTFNYKEYLYNNKIYYTYTVSKMDILEKENVFYKIKNKIVNKINNYDDNIKPYLSLFILGDKTYLDSNLYDSYRSNGIWHLFAVSGMHISLLINVLDILLKKLKHKNIIISICLFYFMFLTSFSASVMRATLFFYLKSLFTHYNIEVSSIKILYLTAFIILLINPFMFYNVGFRYSFLITYAIMLESKNITGNYFIKIFKISLLSFFVSLPITVNMNYEVNLLSIILNVFYVPFISLIIFPLSILTFIFPFLSFILNILLIILENSNILFSTFKLNIVIPKMFFLVILIYYLFLFLYHKFRYKKIFIFLCLLLLINYYIPKLDNYYYVYFLDVNQGDSIILMTPYKKDIVMIDTGGLINSDYQVSNNTITFLKSLGITKIDTLILSHGDYDHMGETQNIIDNINVKEVIFNNDKFNTLELNLINELEKKKIKYINNIDNLKVGILDFKFLNNKLYDNENDNSNVLYTEIDNYKFLFMGDAGKDAEKNIINNYSLTSIDVLKVGHHGSKTSSSKYFIDNINPVYSIISVGKNNLYNHPNKEVLNNLDNSKIYRTDINGSIIFKIKNKKIEIITYAPEEV